MVAKNFYGRWWARLTLGCQRVTAWSRRASTAFARPAVLVALMLVLVPVGVMLLKPAAKASGGIIVNTTADETTDGDGFCSLREAITNANDAAQTYTDCADPGGTTATITFDASIAGGTITLVGSTLPGIVHTLTIDGSGKNITVDGASSYQVLHVNSGATLTLNYMTIANGRNSGSNGGGVFNQGTLSVTNSTFSGNSSTAEGGGIFNWSSGPLTVTNSTFSGNSASVPPAHGLRGRPRQFRQFRRFGFQRPGPFVVAHAPRAEVLLDRVQIFARAGGAVGVKITLFLRPERGIGFQQFGQAIAHVLARLVASGAFLGVAWDSSRWRGRWNGPDRHCGFWAWRWRFRWAARSSPPWRRFPASS